MAKIADDKYYTPKAVVKKVIEIVSKEIMPIEQFSRIIEPSAGAGAFLRELPPNAIGYDILPEYEGIVKGDYLVQEIPYKKNGLVIGNPPFGVSGDLAQKFIKKSMEHSDFVAFVIPGTNYKRKSKIPGVKLFKSYMLPKVKYSGVELSCCFNIYVKGEEKEKRIKGVEIFAFSRTKNTTKEQEMEFLKIKCDYRMISLGECRIVDNEDKELRLSEIKIIFDKKKNFKPVLEAFIKHKKKSRTTSRTGFSKWEIEELIYDTYEDLRAN